MSKIGRMRIRKDKPGFDPIRYATDLEVAWAAGIYEGEGCCVVNGNGRSFTIAVSQKDPELLYRLRDLFGGTVKERSNERNTNLLSDGTRVIFDWRIHGDRGRVFIASVYPFLTSRRKAQVARTGAIKFVEYVGVLPGSDIIPFLHTQIARWVSEHRSAALGRRKQYQDKFYEDHKSDPAFMEKRRQMTAAWRARKKEYQHAGNSGENRE